MGKERSPSETEDDSAMSSEDSGSEDLFEDSKESPYDELVIHIDGMIKNLEPSPSSERCIYRVPETLRKLNEQAYTPRVVSIGPFHHGSERLRSMEAVKKRYFKKLVERSKTSLRSYVELVKGLEGKARECYVETLVMGSDEFVSMMLIDACFIIELLLKSYYTHWNKEDGHVLSTPWLRADVRLDLMLLENQIPFFVLEEIFTLVVGSNQVLVQSSLLNLTLHFVKKYNIHETTPNFLSPNHFADLIMILYRPKSPRPPRTREKFQSVYSATELHEAGVNFRVGSSKCLLDVNFTKEVLEIPCFRLNDHTETIIRNLMALELCHYPTDSYIIDYILFMDYLINTPKDIDLLIKNGIIVNWLGESSAAADLFNNLCKNITIDDDNFYFSRVCEDLNAYYKVPKHKWKATFRRDYFSTPWKTASTIAAITLLVLTLIQTIFSILSFTSTKL